MSSWIAAIWLAFVMLAGNIERQHLARTALIAGNLEVGQTESDVSSQLGPPLGDYKESKGWTFLAIGKHPRQWCYGTRINLDGVFITDPIVSVNPLPINFRWFGYGDDDLVVDLDGAGRVARIGSPKIRYEVDHRYDGILNTIYSLNTVGKEFAKAIQAPTLQK